MSTLGVKNIKVKAIGLGSLSNTEDVSKELKIEVIKDKPTVTNFGYSESETDPNELLVNFTFNDKDNAIKSATIIVTDENQEEITKQTIGHDATEISFTRTSSQTYNFKMLLSYDLDTNAIEIGKNEVEDEIALDEQIVLDKRMIEMKDIQDVYLYKKTDNGITEIYSVSPNDLNSNLDSYLVKVQMKDLPEFYATIKKYIIEDNKLKFELDYEDTIQYIGNSKQNQLIITFGSIIAGYAKNNTFESLIREMNSNPRAQITLTQDYDATGFYGNGNALVYPEGGFRGSFNGNGHTIYNLSTPLFSTLENATVQNLILENVSLTTVGANALKGSIAEDAYGTTISNVHVRNFNMTTGDADSNYGALVGKISTNTTLNGCSATNININAKTSIVGGLVGITRYNSKIENCYVTGNINATATQVSKMVTSIGGICGYAESTETSTITHCLTKVNLTSTDGPAGNGGILGNAANGSIQLIQNVSLSTGRNAYKIFGGTISDGKSSGNYEYLSSTLNTNMLGGYTNMIMHSGEITGSFFENKVGFSKNNWVLDDVSYSKLPVLRNSDPNRNGTNAEVYIPSHDRLKNISEYDPNKVIAYSNIYKLMPFYDSKYIITDGNKINQKDILNTKTIKTILAYDNQHNLVTSLTEENENYKSISSIKVVFTDNTTKDYEVTYKDFYGHIVCYQIGDLGIEYNYDKYVIKQDTGIVNELVTYIQNINYSSQLEKIAKVEFGNRIYRDYFNETTKTMAKDFVLKYLENVDGYSVTIDNEILNTIIRNNLIDNDRLEEIMFAYNYYLRWYNIDIQGAKVSDMMLFKGELYSKNMGIEYLTKEIKTSRWLNSPHTKYFYRDNIGHRTGIETISSFMDYNIDVLGNYETTDDWLTENFSGILVELPLEEHPDIDYRAWTQLKKQENYLLVILTLPKNAGYMMSGPTMFMVGSQKIYISNPEDANQRQQLLTRLQDYGKKYITTFYNTTAGFIEPKYMNSFADIQMDRPYIIGSTEEQEKDGKTQDPFNKNFYEAMYNWHRISGVAAYAQDGEMYWVAYAAIGNEWNYINTWTHETGHNQAVKLFLKDNGRRPSGSTITVDEDYPDGNTSQKFNDGAVNFNLSFNYPVEAMVTTNLTTERINSKEKIESYYKEMFEAIDFLDYAEAKAFLQLTPKEQSAVAVQVYYSGSTVGWKSLSEEQFAEMNLKTIEDIYDNHITIRPNSAGTSQEAYGAYGSEGMYVRRWYQPHNDSGRTHSHGLKYTAWQMLGEGGYDGGYVAYYSGKSSNDLDAIRKVTKDSTMTWKKYKLGRYDLMEKNWNNAYLNSDELVKQYVQALKADAANSDRSVTQSTNIRRINYHYLKRVTNDFREEVLVNTANPIHITNAQEFKEIITKNKMGYYVLDNDINLSSLTGENSIIPGYFIGKLDGNGHKLTGNTVPIFENVKYSHICNLEIEGTNITSDAESVGALAKKITDSKIENIKASKINVQSTQKEVAGLIGAINNCAMKNIEVTDITIPNGTIRVGAIVGIAENSNIEDSIVNKANITAQDEAVGGVAGVAIETKIKNVHVTETNITGAYRVGVFLGYIGKTTIEECSSNGTAIARTGNSAGGFVGEAINSTVIKNCYALGTVTGIHKVGGFIGTLNSSSIENSFSFDKAISESENAGFIGQSLNDSTVKNSIAFGNQRTGHKFDAVTTAEQFEKYSNNYEYEESIGGSTLSRAGIDFTGKISVATKQNITDTEFYISTLKWDNNIWNLNNVTNGHTPKLKNSDPNETVNIIPEIVHIKTAEEFKTLLTNEPEGHYALDNNIDVSTLTGENAIIDETFYGRLDGQENKIIGNTLPIFNSLENAQISNLAIEGSNITSEEQSVGALAKRVTNATIKNITANKINVQSTQSEVAGLIGYMNNSTMKNVQITDITVPNGTIRVGALVGFVENSTITNSIISKVNITSKDEAAGGVAGLAIGLTTKDVHVTEANISGKSRVGAFLGYIGLTTIEECSSNGTVTAKTDTSAGGFVGEAINNTTIQNCYSVGNVKGTQKVGGFIGYLRNSTITNCFSRVMTTGNSQNGGFIGQSVENSTIENSIAFGNTPTGYKFDGAIVNTQIARYANNYEYEESLGTSIANRTGNFTGKIGIASKQNVTNTEFYISTLKWDANIWNFAGVTREELPKLKNSDPNKTIQLETLEPISTADEFISKLQENPNGAYELKEDISLSEFSGRDSVITETFKGKLEGNGHTISDLKNSALFAEFRGSVQNLNIKDFTNVSNGDYVSAFAKTVYKATVKNVKFENITLHGKNYVAVVAGMDGPQASRSVFENISVKNADVTGTGFYVSAFIGRKYEGTIKNCYVQGKVECYATDCGGVVGAAEANGMTIENVIANVNINRPKSTDARNINGGVLGNSYFLAVIKNTVSLGSMTGFTDNSGTYIDVAKFTGKWTGTTLYPDTFNTSLSYITNNYEYEDTTGTSIVTEATKGHIDVATSEQIHDISFWKGLNYDENIWNFATVLTEGHPELK